MEFLPLYLLPTLNRVFFLKLSKEKWNYFSEVEVYA